MLINSNRSKEYIKRVLQAGRLAGHSFLDTYRFWRHSAMSAFDGEYEQLSARIIYNVHALEKGLAQTTMWRPGRGRKALKNLNDALVMYQRKGYDVSAFAYVQGVSILQRYQERHSDSLEQIRFLPDIVDPTLLQPSLPGSFAQAGVKTVKRDTSKGSQAEAFYALSQARSSVRIFADEPIDTRKVEAVLRNAGKTPSVCNRQGWNVYWTEDKELSRRVLKHQRGFGQERMPEVLLTITVSNSTFISPVERNQGFIDGGLFAMSVLYGLEAEGLAAVPLNASLYLRARNAIKQLLGLAASEEIIMFIAVGAHPPESTVPVSERKPLSSYLTVVTSDPDGASALQARDSAQ